MNPNNCFSCVGRLTMDPEYKETSNKKQFAIVNIAIDADAPKSENRPPHYAKIVIWNESTVNKYLPFITKGDLVSIVAQYNTSKYQDKNGGDRTNFEFVVTQFGGGIKLLTKKGSQDAGDGNDGGNGGHVAQVAQTPPVSPTGPANSNPDDGQPDDFIRF